MKNKKTCLLILLIVVSLNISILNYIIYASDDALESLFIESGSGYYEVYQDKKIGYHLNSNLDGNIIAHYNEKDYNKNISLAFNVIDFKEEDNLTLTFENDNKYVHLEFKSISDLFFSVSLYLNNNNLSFDENDLLISFPQIPYLVDIHTNLNNLIKFNFNQDYSIIAGSLVWNFNINGFKERLNDLKYENLVYLIENINTYNLTFRSYTENDFSLILKSISDTNYYVHDYYDIPSSSNNYSTYTSAQIFWTNPDNFEVMNVGGYIIEKYKGNQTNIVDDIVLLATTNRESFSETNLKQGTTYTYIIKGVDDVSSEVPITIFEYSPIIIQTTKPILDKILLQVIIVIVFLVIFAFAYIYYYEIKKTLKKNLMK